MEYRVQIFEKQKNPVMSNDYLSVVVRKTDDNLVWFEPKKSITYKIRFASFDNLKGL